MSSREKILNAVRANQFNGPALPDIEFLERKGKGTPEKFKTVLSSIGGEVFYINSLDEVSRIVARQFSAISRIVNLVPGIQIPTQETLLENIDPAQLHSVDLALIPAHFAVAENGAVWVTAEDLSPRVIPFICEHLAIVINSGHIVPTMHEAYQLIANYNYGYSVFIAGPSKTADIEQSLVIGAHGPRSLTVFIKV